MIPILNIYQFNSFDCNEQTSRKSSKKDTTYSRGVSLILHHLTRNRHVKILFYCLISCSLCVNLSAQSSYKTAVIGFYNLENLYDTEDDLSKDDNEFLPKSDKRYTAAIYADKLNRLATVIAAMGSLYEPVVKDGPAILGVAEIENKRVLEDLVAQPELAAKKMRIVHFESPDIRGIDVALLYDPKYFKVINAAPIRVILPGGSKESSATRDILWVHGILDGESVHVYVNHWPSRRGGEAVSAPARMAAATTLRKHVDSLQARGNKDKYIIMGDLNDDPKDRSITKGLNANGDEWTSDSTSLYNPWVKTHKKGIGTLAYQDAWNLFDQIIISRNWLNKDQTGFAFFKNYIHTQPFMREESGRYKGYPKRTWSGDEYNYGYSDHFPTYLVLLKRVGKQEKSAK